MCVININCNKCIYSTSLTSVFWSGTCCSVIFTNFFPGEKQTVKSKMEKLVMLLILTFSFIFVNCDQKCKKDTSWNKKNVPDKLRSWMESFDKEGLQDCNMKGKQVVSCNEAHPIRYKCTNVTKSLHVTVDLPRSCDNLSQARRRQRSG